MTTEDIRDYIDGQGRFRLRADVVARHRIELNVSVQVLAEKAGIHPQSLYAYERGTRLPSPPIAVKLAKALGLELFEIGEVVK